MVCPAIAQEVTDPLLPDPREMARIEAAVDRALEYLAQEQEDDGSWPSEFGNNNGINAVCVLAFLGRGHAPGRGPYRHVVDRGVRFLLATQDETGLYKSVKPSHGPMYEHALATLALIEAYGFVPTPAMRKSVQKAVDLIVKSQAPVGGWRYHPVPRDADLSVTVMQVVALRAAQNARLNVPDETVKRATAYVRACIHPNGGFSYQPGGGAAPPRSAAGVLSLQLLGHYDDPGVTRGLEYMQKQGIHGRTKYLFYFIYYSMQAAFQAGGEHWHKWHPKVRDFLLQWQNDDGSWPGFSAEKFNGKSRCYSTAFATIALEVYMHFLPAYQR